MNKDQLLATPNVTRFRFVATVCALLIGASACSNASATRVLRYEIVAEHPHDVGAFTQGLLLHGERLIESTGGYGRSDLREVERRTGAVRRRMPLPDAHFGEGAALAGERIVQLTWQSGLALVYDALTLAPVGRHRYDGEGWGLAFDGRDFLMSDGSARIARRSAKDFAVLGSFVVSDRGQPVTRLNELEFAAGWLWANVWTSDRIAMIDPASGEVAGWLELAALKARFDKPRGWRAAEHVLNGIAADPATGHLWVTGKCWPVLFELKVEIPAAR